MIVPSWPAPANVRAYTTTRNSWGSDISGVNSATAEQLGSLDSLLSLPASPVWMQQTHSNIALSAAPENHGEIGDGVFTCQPNQVCMILTADCLPVLICDRDGNHAAAIHAGWRGLASGVIENTINAMGVNSETLMAWLGPAIGPDKFEVGADVFHAFTDQDPASLSSFKAHAPDKWMANLYQLATLRLNRLGIDKIYGGEYCTHSQKDLFFSYRRDHLPVGRMASVIWIDR